MDRNDWVWDPEWRELVMAQVVAQLTMCILELLGRERRNVPPDSDMDLDLARWRSALANHLGELREIACQVREEHGLSEDSDPDGSKPLTHDAIIHRLFRDEPDYFDS